MTSRVAPSDHAPSAPKKFRVVIVGAGLGGCIAAHALASDFDVTVIELGAAVEDMQERIVDVGRPAGGDTPHLGAGLGGSTALWHNVLIEVDEEIFRDHWPFSKAELMPWYEAAYPLLAGVERSQLTDLAQSTREKYEKLGVTADVFQLQFVPTKRRNLWHSLGLAGRVKLVRGEAHRLKADGPIIRSVLVSTSAGEKEIEGDYIILAAGGLGTPVLLESLAETISVPSLRNAGRYYEDHPIAFIGQATIPSQLYRLWNSSAPGGSFRFLSVMRHQGLHFSFQLRPAAMQLREDRDARMGSILTKLRNQIWNPMNWIRLLAYWDDVLDIFSMKFRIRIPTSHYSIFMQAGQPTLPDRAVSRSWEPGTGRRLIHRKWVFSQEYLQTVRGAIDRFTGELRRIARSVTIMPNWADALATGAHHSGTARMSRTPCEGVCDPHGRIHGLENIFIADGSVIPCSGVANTGLTIAALALRLADHLKTRVRDVRNGEESDRINDLSVARDVA